MKKIIALIVIVFSIIIFQSDTRADNGSDGYFYNALAPYGQWIETNDGLMVWHPTFLDRNWAPYTYGNWEWTNDGWYWNSDEPFGYITYHYGRWYNDDYYGWIWVPDDQWAPAWVEWRYDDDNIGWAPLPPYAEFTIGIGLHYTHEYHPNYAYWNFVRYNHFCDVNVYNYYAGPKVKYRIYNNTVLRNDYDYNNGRIINRGIGYDRVKERSGKTILTREIVRVTDPRQLNNNGNKDVIRTYIATRNDVSRNNLGNINIRRPERNSSLDVSKINLSAREQTRSNDINRQSERQNNQNNQTIQDRQIQERQIQDRQIQDRQRIEQGNTQRQQQVDQQNRQNQVRQQIDQNRKNQDQQLRQQQIDQQNRQRQQQIDQQNRQNQMRQQIDQQNRQRQQQVDQNRQNQMRQQVDQQNRQRQQQVNQQNRQKEQVQQRKAPEQKQTEKEDKTSGRGRR